MRSDESKNNTTLPTKICQAIPKGDNGLLRKSILVSSLLEKTPRKPKEPGTHENTGNVTSLNTYAVHSRFLHVLTADIILNGLI